MKQPEHKKYIAQEFLPVKFALLITSDSRTEKTDKTGRLVIDYLEKAGHLCIKYKIVKNEVNLIRKAATAIINSDAKLLITSGGTGCGEKDVTIEVVTSLISKKLDGFGELFRFLSYKKIGSSAIMSRALLGITKNKTIICSLPGAPRAVSLALGKLLIPELQHIIWELTRRGSNMNKLTGQYK
jgi:molybdopterin adenylyltransferase